MTDIKNMSYYFNKQYFRNLRVEIQNNGADEKLLISLPEGESFAERNKELISFPFQYRDGSFRPWDIEGVKSFQLTTVYPGLLMGMGYTHELKHDDAVKCGFSFDYVSGLPCLQSSSLKGTLRNLFPEGASEKEKNKAAYIRALLGKGETVDIEMLKKNIFEGGDIFLDVFPVPENKTEILSPEYITPHNKGKFANPIPIKLIKVKPNITFRFCFLLTDFMDETGEVLVSGEEKLALFRQLILDGGIGAKTNVGFGKFRESPVPDEKSIFVKAPSFVKKPAGTKPGICKNCGKQTVINKSTKRYFDYCQDCYQNYKKEHRK